MKLAIFVVAVCLLAGCAGADIQVQSLMAHNNLKIEPTPGRPYDYVVRISNVKDIGPDLDDRDSRFDVASRAIRNQCPSARLLGEDIIERGTALLGWPLRDYLVQVKCYG